MNYICKMGPNIRGGQLLRVIAFLGCYTVWMLEMIQTFQECLLPPSSLRPTLEIKAAGISHMSAPALTATRCNNARTEFTTKLAQ
jgi:hypothetical protein